jgi:hypothetical protein
MSILFEGFRHADPFLAILAFIARCSDPVLLATRDDEFAATHTSWEEEEGRNPNGQER